MNSMNIYNTLSTSSEADFIESGCIKREPTEIMIPEVILREVDPATQQLQHVGHQPQQNLDFEYVQIGPNGTIIPKRRHLYINWSTWKTATRCLVDAIFDRKVLQTHTLSGKPSPAFIGRSRATKQCLDPAKILDITVCIKRTFPDAKAHDIRAHISAKCATAAKRLNHILNNENEENTNVVREN